MKSEFSDNMNIYTSCPKCHQIFIIFHAAVGEELRLLFINIFNLGSKFYVQKDRNSQKNNGIGNSWLSAHFVLNAHKVS